MSNATVKCYGHTIECYDVNDSRRSEQREMEEAMEAIWALEREEEAKLEKAMQAEEDGYTEREKAWAESKDNLMNYEW
jgi:hypothetical protein